MDATMNNAAGARAERCIYCRAARKNVTSLSFLFFFAIIGPQTHPKWHFKRAPTMSMSMNGHRPTARSLLLSLATLPLLQPSSAFTILPRAASRASFLSLEMSSAATMMDAMSEAVSKSLGKTVRLEAASGGGYRGGGGASTSAVVDPETGNKYFVKSAGGGHDMLRAEYLGVKEMSETNTIQVPKPVAFGDGPHNIAFVVFEYLDFCGGGSGYELGVQLAKMHRCTSENGKFGFHVDNTIGATPQPNLPWMDDWPNFWDEHRLRHMLKLTGGAGLSKADVEKLRSKTRELLSHKPTPSLLHGDLWGGNKSYAKVDGKVVPIIFDPATYYGDREADVAMTYLFGGFSSDFYEGYESEWPLPEVS